MQTEINGYTIQYTVTGKGYPVILVHGLYASHHDWDELIPVLTKFNFNSFALDMLGHGESDNPENPALYNADYFFTTFETWLTNLRLSQKPILIGHSFGGYLLLKYASLQADNDQPLILINPLFTPNQLSKYLRNIANHPKAMHKISINKPVWLLDLLIKTNLFNMNQFTPQAKKQLVEDIKSSSPYLINILRNLPDLTVQLKKIPNPIYLIWGEKDPTLSPTYYPILLDKLNVIQYKTFPGIGHQPHIVNSKIVNNLIITIIGKLTIE